MPTYSYPYGNFVLEVTAANDEELDMRDVYGDGVRRSFGANGGIVVDFSARMVLEERTALLSYRILESGVPVFQAGGRSGRTYRGGQRRPGFDPIVHSF
jgi:hypothetical protein